jgi:hypothetical protein
MNIKLKEAIELLESLGFEQFDSEKDDHYLHESIHLNEGDLLYIGNQGSRNCIYIMLTSVYERYYEYTVYILNNVGCGTTELPFHWGELSADWLTLLVMAFTGEPFKLVRNESE